MSTSVNNEGGVIPAISFAPDLGFYQFVTKCGSERGFETGDMKNIANF